MKKKRYIFLTLVLFLLNIQPTSAACTEEEINNFKKIEDEYTVKYQLDYETKQYHVYFNAPKRKTYDYVIYIEDGFTCEDTDDVTARCYPFASGEYKIEIVGQTTTCNDVLKTMTLKLPKYNKLADDPLCEGIEEFVLCNPSYDKEVEYDDFVSRVNTYKKKHTSTKQEDGQDSVQENNKTNDTLNKIINYVENHWIEITIITVFVILLFITIIVAAKSARKSRYLE